MTTNERGNYAFLPGTSFLSFAAVAQPGFAIERAVFRTPRPIENALDAAAKHLQERGRPLNALCGFEFRQFAPRQYTAEEFASFNAAHVKRMGDADLLVEGMVPMVRTNVVVNVADSPRWGGLHAFSYTVPLRSESSVRYFVFAAAPEVRFRPEGYEVVATGEVSREGLERKTDFILDVVDERLSDLGLKWDDVTGAQLYCEEDLHPLLCSLVRPRMRGAAWRGIHWIHSLPPVGPAIIELDLRSVCGDVVVD